VRIIFNVILILIFASSLGQAKSLDPSEPAKKSTKIRVFDLDAFKRELREHYGTLPLLLCFDQFQVFVRQFNKSHGVYEKVFEDEDWNKALAAFDECAKNFKSFQETSKLTFDDLSSNGPGNGPGNNPGGDNKGSDLGEGFHKKGYVPKKSSDTDDLTYLGDFPYSVNTLMDYLGPSSSSSSSDSKSIGDALKESSSDISPPGVPKGGSLASPFGSSSYYSRSPQTAGHFNSGANTKLNSRATVALPRDYRQVEELKEGYRYLSEFEELEKARDQAKLLKDENLLELERRVNEEREKAKERLLDLMSSELLSKRERLNAYAKYQKLHFDYGESVSGKVYDGALDILKDAATDYAKGIKEFSDEDGARNAQGTCPSSPNSQTLPLQELSENTTDVLARLPEGQRPEFLTPSLNATTAKFILNAVVSNSSSAKFKAETEANKAQTEEFVLRAGLPEQEKIDEGDYKTPQKAGKK